MARLSREESQEITRAKLLAAARVLFAQNGYGMTSLDRIAEEAGFSKGAVYSNFSGKEDLFLAVLEEQGRTTLDDLTDALAAGGNDPMTVIDRIAAWSDRVSKSGNWPMLVLEHARHTQNAERPKVEEDIFHAYWHMLGEHVCAALALGDRPRELIGAMIFELTYAPAMNLVAKPTAGDLVRFALASMIPHLEAPSHRAASDGV
jgi:TetR/AcrR family transcriptional regulator, transcriptional repressor of aconitase